MKIKSCTWLLLLLCSYAYGQIENYGYKRELKGISEQWHSIVLPNTIFEKVSQDLSDIRIFGIAANNDTIEVPYVIRKTTEKVSSKHIDFNILNTSYNDKGYYFTFEIPTSVPINQIKLDFDQRNFDWQLKLEGSQNQQEWFTVTDNYRILAITTNEIDFRYTKLTFPSSKYRYFRLLIESKEKPLLTVASIEQYEITNGVYRDYAIKNSSTTENRKAKQTEIDIELQMPVPVNSLSIDVKDAFDYYRPVTIKYLADSSETEQGWKYHYSTLASKTLNSIENGAFKLDGTTVQKLKITIYNQDNQALTIGSIKIKGYVHELVARFTKPANYFLTYQNDYARKPHYDIERFTNKIPKKLATITVGTEQIIEKEEVTVIAPLFQNKNWLWIIMIVIVVLLGWFSVKMISKD